MLKNWAVRRLGIFSPLRASRFSSTIKNDVSNDMLLSASLGWTSKDPTSQEELTQVLQKNNMIKRPAILEVFKQVDRKYFCERNEKSPYSLDPADLANGQKLTSPIMHAVALEALYDPLKLLIKLRFEEDNIDIADIGFGYGCTTAMLALLAQKIRDKYNPNLGIRLTGYEIYPGFINKAKASISRVEGVDLSKIDFVHSDIYRSPVSNRHDIINCGCAFTEEHIAQSITYLVEDKSSSYALVPVLRPDGEQDLMLYNYSTKTRHLRVDKE